MAVDAPDLLAFATLGLLGAAHCAGMCGGFAVAVATAAPRGRGLTRQLLYVSGKALTYASLGLVLATGARAAVRAGAGPERLEALPQALALVAGGTMVGLGLLALRGGAPRPPLERWGAPGRALRAAGQELGRAFRAARALPGGTGAFAAGLATGLLPCGWSWGALALAATVPPLEAGLGMLLFGLGTAPALVAVGLGWSGLSVRFRGLAARAAGPLLIVFGLLTVLRGAALVGGEAAARAALPECCVDESGATTP